MKKQLSIFLILVISSCGFKIVDHSKLTNYKVINIETIGEKRINYKLKNKLLINNSDINAKSINLVLNTSKQRIIKERNIRNEITKYSLKINVKAEALIPEDEKRLVFNVAKNGDYLARDKYSQTLNNEKKLIELLTDDISDEIYNKLISKLNDL